jgi:hypothetical protein
MPSSEDKDLDSEMSGTDTEDLDSDSELNGQSHNVGDDEESTAPCSCTSSQRHPQRLYPSKRMRYGFLVEAKRESLQQRNRQAALTYFADFSNAAHGRRVTALLKKNPSKKKPRVLNVPVKSQMISSTAFSPVST